MLQFIISTAYFWYNGAADMRKNFDSLCGIILEHMPSHVLQGGVYILVNRKRNQIKLLTWEGDGLAIYYKRLEKNTYEIPALTPGSRCVTLDSLQLQWNGVSTGQ